jgi:hypothetical protein
MAKAKSWRTSDVKYHFRSPGFEFVFQWILGMQTHGASEVGESFFAASQIKDGDPASWVTAWRALAARVEQRAASSLEREHVVSAREAYLRAYTSYCLPTTGRHSPSLTRFARQRRCPCGSDPSSAFARRQSSLPLRSN